MKVWYCIPINYLDTDHMVYNSELVLIRFIPLLSDLQRMTGAKICLYACLPHGHEVEGI